jgi:uncharacterized OsmC-like protein
VTAHGTTEQPAPADSPGERPDYVSRVTVEMLDGPDRRALLPPDGAAVRYGVHGTIAEHYRVDTDRFAPIASTLDHVVAATAACLAGTFGGMLRARKIAVDDGSLTASGRGEIATIDGVLTIRRIVVHYVLAAPAEQHERAERAHSIHAEHCPVARSLSAAIAIDTSLELAPPPVATRPAP